MIKKNLKIDLLIASFLGVFAILLVPAPLRGSVVIFLLISAFLNYKKNFKKSYFALNTLLYFGLLLTLIYSTNRTYGQSFVLETQISLLAFPLSFALLSDSIFRRLVSFEKLALLIFTGSTFLLSLLPFAWLLPPHNYNLKIFLHHYNGLLLSPDLKYFQIHPVYLGLAVGLSILVLIYLGLKNRTKKWQILYGMAILYFLILLILLAKRGVLFGLFFSSIGLFWFYRSRKLFAILITGFILSFVLALNFPKIQKRFTTIWQVSSIKNSSASKHLRIYKPAWHLFLKAPFFGHGLGSHKDLLIKQYETDGEKDLFKEGLNTHNQLMSFLIIGGLSLAMVFMLYWIGLFYKSLTTGEYFLIVILIFFTVSMLFENILERAQGVLIFALFISYFSRKSFIEKDLENQRKVKKIVLIGPLPPPVTGESQCNYFVLQSFQNNISYINTATPYFDEKVGGFDWKKVFFNLKKYFLGFYIFKGDIVYATIGQTFLGVLKFAPFFILSKISRKPIIIHIHGNNLGFQYEQLKGFKKALFKRIIQMATKAIVLSESLKTNLTPFLSNQQIRVLPNFVDPLFSDVSESILLRKDFKRLKIVFLSNLMTQKGIFELLKAFEILEQENFSYQAVLIGEIDERIKSSVFSQLKKLKHTTYKGPLYKTDKKLALLDSNLFILPSYREGQPLSIFEAMITGNLVITTPQPGITDLFNDKEVFYVPIKDVEALVKQIKKIGLNLSSLQTLSTNNHQKIKKHFTLEIFIQNLKHILYDF